MDSFGDWFWLFIVVIFAIGFAGFLFIGHIRALSPAAIETGKKPIYRGAVSGTVGQMTHKGPLLNLRVYDDFLVIDGNERILLAFENIDRIVVEPMWFRPGRSYLQIVHHQPATQERIVLTPHNPEQIRDLIEARLPHPLP